MRFPSASSGLYKLVDLLRMGANLTFHLSHSALHTRTQINRQRTQRQYDGQDSFPHQSGTPLLCGARLPGASATNSGLRTSAQLKRGTGQYARAATHQAPDEHTGGELDPQMPSRAGF